VLRRVAEIDEGISKHDSMRDGSSPAPASTPAPCNQSILLILDLPAADQIVAIHIHCFSQASRKTIDQKLAEFSK